jgi:hypothetical protein
MNLLSTNDMPLREAALYYASLGWPVLPLKGRQKQPATKHGLHDASIAKSKINDWWDKWPDANIGLRTGVAFDALDLDGKAGVTAFYEIKPEYYHPGPISATGNGYHLLFKVSGSKNHAKIEDVPIDFRGKNGYIVVAPSVHPLGHRYKWQQSGERLPVVPAWLSARLFSPKAIRTTDPNDPKLKEALDRAGDLVELFTAMGREVTRGPNNLMVVSCPFHPGDNEPSLYIYPNNTFYCFGCGNNPEPSKAGWGDALNVRKWLKTGRLRG